MTDAPITVPSSPMPAIRPSWPKGIAATSACRVVVFSEPALPLSMITTLGPDPIDQPLLLRR